MIFKRVRTIEKIVPIQISDINLPRYFGWRKNVRRYVIISNCSQRLLNILIHCLLKFVFKEDGMFLMAIAIFINSKKHEAILLDLASIFLTALLAGASTSRKCSISCQN